jgi:hypothetical protein
MVRAISYLLSFWLAGLFVVGQNAHIPKLLIFFVGLGAALALLGAMIAPIVSPAWRLGGPIALSIGLFSLCAVALAMKVPPWLPFCVGVGTVCFIGITIAEVLWSPRNRGTMGPIRSPGASPSLTVTQF